MDGQFGRGLSDRDAPDVPDVPDVRQLGTVLDASGGEPAALFGCSCAGAGICAAPGLQTPPRYYEGKKLAYAAMGPMGRRFSMMFDEMRKVKGYPIALDMDVDTGMHAHKWSRQRAIDVLQRIRSVGSWQELLGLPLAWLVGIRLADAFLFALGVTVAIDVRDCIGCDVCVAHCDKGVLRMVDGKALVDLRNLNKCDLDGECVEVCPTQARIFGDLKSKASRLVRFARMNKIHVLKPSLNTEPKVYYAQLDGEVR